MSKKPKPPDTWTVYEWRMFGEIGLSSDAMMRHIFKMRDPMRPNAKDHPHDPADLRRCRLALEKTGSEHRIHECGSISPEWSGLVTHWRDICETMDRECPDWRDGRGSAPETWKKMRSAMYGSKA